MIKIGQGFDLHRLVEGRKLILGGVDIPFHLGLDGHSDADVLAHAIIDALIGALGLGDIGKFFPDNDARYKNINSLDLLAQISAQLVDSQYKIVNIDTTIILEKPKLRNYIDSMRANIARVLDVAIEQINIKAKTSEAIGIVGRSEAAVAQAIVLISKP